MDSDAMEDSVFSLGEESDDYVPQKKTKPAAKSVSQPAVKKLAKSKTKAPAKRPKPESEDESAADSSGFSHTPPSSKKQRKDPPPKKSGGVPLAEVENDSIIIDTPAKVPKKAGTKTATDTYQKLTQLEHIIKRPDTYIGSVERTEQAMWVFNKTTSLMEHRNVSFVPGLYKIFDEIIVNAADNKQRNADQTYIKINMSRETGEISVENNGKGIPIEIHQKEKIYIPELIFGHLLAGSNFDDDEKKTVGGRNGYGSKLCNVFSTEFSIELQDKGNGKRYRQTWTDNMQKMQKAKITSNKTTSDFVRITFHPDYNRFGMPNGIDDDLEALIYRRIYDVAGTVDVKVYLNGELIKIKDFKSYCDLYAKSIAAGRSQEEGGTPTCTVEMDKDKTHPRWEVGFTVSDGTFQQVSFVNSIATTMGGTHVNYITDQITASLLKNLSRKKKGHGLKQAHLRNHIFVFINCYIENPAFNSQTKEQMTTKASQFGSKCVLGDNFLRKVANSDALQNIMDFAEKKADKMLAKSDGSKRSRVSNAKLVEANLAGTRRGHECTLILTEGDSAKGLAVSGRAILDPDRIGVFPLRGKLLNVRDASVDQITKNQEIQNIKQFLGLKHKQVYTDTKSLRYGHLMIMADQDHDGSHIKGLLINFLQVQFPSLLQIPDFFREFITPIVKVWQGPNPEKPTKRKDFFSLPQFEEWKDAHQRELSKWQSRYLKGLGSSSNADAQRYFSNLDDHLKEFGTMKSDEAELFDLVFSKKKADARKEWLGNYIPGTSRDHVSKSITYGDFVNQELIQFSIADNMRSIPSVLDGLKPGQRKVLYACLKRNFVKEMKVVELAGYVSGATAYHHGEMSLQQTIIGLAQNYVGSNNINLLEPSSNFGSRLAGGQDAASPRYIFTRLSPFARRIFSAMDEPNLKPQYDDDKLIEPEVYAPIIPMVLVNGADGIGTGWSTTIPNYHPMDIVRNLKRRMGRLDDDDVELPFQTMMPWFRGWKGTPEVAGPDRYKFNGIAYQDDKNPNEVIITELPIRMWTDDFKAKLEKVISGLEGPSWIKDYKEFNDHTTVHFEIMVDEKHMPKVLEEGILERFKLLKQIATSNLVAFDTNGQIRKYEKVEDILEEFYVYRLDMYGERKKHWLGVHHANYRKLKNQARFIQEIIDGVMVVGKKKKTVLVQELRQRKYEAFPPSTKNKKAAGDDAVDEDDEDEDDEGGARDYDYLLGMAIWSLTAERLAKLLDAIAKKKAEYDYLQAKSEKDLWCEDLEEFEREWERQLALDKEIKTNAKRMGRRASKKIGAGRSKKGQGDDEYEPGGGKSRVKPKATTTKASALSKPAAAPKPLLKSNSAQRFASMFAGDDDFSDDDFANLSRSKAPAASQATTDIQPSQSQSEEPEAPRTKRMAASKAKAIVEADSDSDDADVMMTDDIGAMVKGIGKPEDSPSRFSLHAMARPESSHTDDSATNTKSNSASKSAKAFDFDDDADETNYKMLARSPQRSISKASKFGSFLSDEEKDPITDDPIPAVKKIAKPRSTAPKAKPAAKPKPSAAKKQNTLSPAAKAYAARKATSKSALADDSDDDIGSPSPKPAPRSRPGRAAATKKKAIVLDDDSEEEEGKEESDDPFEMDSDE